MMDWDDTKPALIAHLSRYNSFVTEAALGRFYQAVLKSAAKIRRKGEWWWKNQTATLTTTAGLKGPYDPPETFYRFALERKIYRFGFTDADGVVLAPIRETQTQRFDLLYRVEDGKFYFRDDPGASVLTLNFVGELSNAPTDANARAAVELMPGNLYDALAGFVEAEFLNDSPDTASEGLNALKLADINLSAEWDEFDKGRNRQKQRSPRGIDGRPLDGMGQSYAMLKGRSFRFPFGRGR